MDGALGAAVDGDAHPPARAFPEGLLERILVQATELLVVTDTDLRCRFVSDTVLEATGFDIDDVIGTPLWGIIHRDDRPLVDAWLDRLGPGVSDELDLRMRLSDRRWHTMNVRARRLRHDDQPWLMFSARDVTEDRANEAALQRRLELERLLERTQQRFLDLTSGTLDETMLLALAGLGAFLDADRAYVLTYDHDAMTESMTHEWHHPDLEPSRHDYQAVPWSVAPEAIARNLALETSAVADVAEVEDPTERAFYQADGLRSLLEIPFAIDGTAAGNLGFDWIRDRARWSDDDIVVLRLFASMFAQVMARAQTERDLEVTLGELRVGFEASPTPVALVDMQGRILRANLALAEMLGRSVDELAGRHSFELVDPEHHDRCLRWGLDLAASDGEDLPRLEAPLATADHRTIWALIEPRPVLSTDSSIANLVVQVTDVTEMRETELALSESELRFRTLVDNLPDPLIRLRPDGRAIFANRAAEESLFRTPAGKFVLDNETDTLLTTARLEAIASGARQRLEFDVETRRGLRRLEVVVVPEYDTAGVISSVLLVSTDLTERRRDEAELAFRATHDALTDLPNRAMFLQHLEAALAALERRGKGLAAVIFFDLDRFKVVNDSMGHASGDQLLRVVARRLRGCLRPGDVVARLGGDEFTVLLDDCEDLEQIRALTARLEAAVAEPISLNGRTIVTTVSAGISFAATGLESPDELLQWADAAMYRAKANGRAQSSMVDDALRTEVLQQLELDQRLRSAMVNDELEVHYQPEVDLQTGAILGAEALLRWRTAGGVHSAASFIGVAEDTGLIVPIGAWVLEAACKQAVEWLHGGADPSFVVRVNLSARQLDHPELVSLVAGVLEQTGLPPGNLCLEITETALMSDAERAKDLLTELDELGVWLAIDDFGTGYSSLSYLKRFPVDVLKIDRSFVDGLPGDAEDLAIVTTIVSLARTLGMQITAEGIETEAQAQVLTELGCPRGQGFHFARPMAAQELTRQWFAQL